MARALSILIQRSVCPAREALQAALKGLKFKLTLDDLYVPFEVSGYLPCTINGEDGGVNIKFEAAQGFLGEHPVFGSAAGDRDALVSLRWSGDVREEICGLMIAAALAQDFDAVVCDVEKQETRAVDKLISLARSKFGELD